MVEGRSVPFSVVYFDGEREINVGTVVVDSSLNFKKFLSLLSQKIGISSHQFSVYLASVGSNRKIPINGKVNFAAIAGAGDGDGDGASFFFVKRSRRSKKNQTQKKDFQKYAKNPPENVMLLRRNPDGHQYTGYFTTAVPPPVLGRGDYEKRVRNLQMERERYLMNMGLNGVYLGMEASNVGGKKNGNGGGLLCEECLRAKQTGSDSGFHCCVNDAVTVGFRSPAGPIARPFKNSGEE